MKNDALTAEEISQFKSLFSKYCRGEINAGHCSDGDCELCSVNKANMEIFDSLEKSSEDKEEDEE